MGGGQKPRSDFAPLVCFVEFGSLSDPDGAVPLCFRDKIAGGDQASMCVYLAALETISAAPYRKLSSVKSA